MTTFNTQNLGWLARRLAKMAGLWGILSIALACTSALILNTKMANMEQQISLLEASMANQQRPIIDQSVEAIPMVQETSLQTLSEFYQTFPTALSIPDTLSKLNGLAAKQQIVLNSGDYKLNKMVANSNNPKVLTQYEMVLPVEGSYTHVRSFISSILSDLPSVAIADLNIERESTLSPSVDARLVLILYVRGDQV